jgi:hypothetical protein
MWPKYPVENFEFDNNTVVNTQGLRPFNLKNSSIHDNYFNNRETFPWCLVGTPAFLNNVKIHNNIFYAKRQDPTRSQYTVELWLHRDGCEYYNNVVDGFFSVVVGKETKVYNNSLLMPTPHQGIGIEFNLQSYSELSHNFIQNPGSHGISVGIGSTAVLYNYLAEEITVRNNVIFSPKYHGILVKSEGGKTRANINTTQDINVYHNTIDALEGIGSYGIYVSAAKITGTGVINNVNVKNNVVANMGRPGLNEGPVKNLVVDHNLFYENASNMWNGCSATNTVSKSPNFLSEGEDYLGYTPVSPSAAIDAGKYVGLPYSGSAPDIGAIEAGTKSLYIAPPSSLRIN